MGKYKGKKTLSRGKSEMDHFIINFINLSVWIQMDTYESIDRPMRMNISL